MRWWLLLFVVALMPYASATSCLSPPDHIVASFDQGVLQEGFLVTSEPTGNVCSDFTLISEIPESKRSCIEGQGYHGVVAIYDALLDRCESVNLEMREAMGPEGFVVVKPLSTEPDVELLRRTKMDLTTNAERDNRTQWLELWVPPVIAILITLAALILPLLLPVHAPLRSRVGRAWKVQAGALVILFLSFPGTIMFWTFSHPYWLVCGAVLVVAIAIEAYCLLWVWALAPLPPSQKPSVDDKPSKPL
jgi:hypothetical protein